jgi:hypothetical protein
VNKCELIDADWQAGFDAGQAGKPNRCPQGIDGLSWSSGYIEGRAQQRRGDSLEKAAGMADEINDPDPGPRPVM